MEDNVFRFDDFLKGKDPKVASEFKKILEDLEEDEESLTELSPEVESPKIEDDKFAVETDIEDFQNTDREESEFEVEEYGDESQEEVEDEVEDEIQIKESSNNYYKLYSDRSENFVCDISIEGANPKETEARLVIESQDWTLMFNGELKNGKCVVPIKKLNILKEGQVGNIRLEVIAEGNLFVPWEDKFKVKVSKKVTVRVNEQKDYYNKSYKRNSKVKVKVGK